MAGAQLDNLLRHLHTLAQARGTEALSDGELVRRFAASGEEAAFTALVRRHGPLVLQLCQRLLHDPHTAEDVFQAAFLVLARNANSLRKPDAVGSFLYGVAYRLARHARADAARRRFHESRRPPPPAADPLAEVSGRELLALLEGELNRLPSKYHSPLVLCCLQGRTRDEAARQLGWSLRTLQRRLEHGRALLHARLSRRGLTLSAVLLGTLLAPPAAPAVPARLLAPTVRAALDFTLRSTAPPSGRAVALAQGILRTMFFTKLKIAAALTAALTLLAAGVCTLAQPAPAARTSEGQPAAGSRSAPPPPPAADTEAERVIRTDDAIAAGLQWLARQQAPDGRWSLDGSYKNDVAATALALLPFLEAGETHKTTGAFHPYARRVERGLRYLLRVQDDAGSFDRQMYMYSHALAALAVCEAYRRTTDPMLKKPAQRAIDFIVQAQHEAGGGWRYTPGQSGDTSVTSYQVRALASARRAGLKVPAQTLTRAGKFLDSVASADGGGYRYIPGAGDATPTMTAAGHMCRLELGGKTDDKKLAKGLAALRRQLPLKDKSDLYLYHYVTRLFERRGGADWGWWEPIIRKLLLDRQDRKPGRHQGSWPADGEQLGPSCGRLLMTSLALLSLQTCARTDRLPPPPAREWKARELADLYAALGDEDFVTARRALRTLAASPRQSVPFLRTVLRPAPPIDARRIDRLIADLDDDKFAVRAKATAELEKLGEVAHPALRKALANKPALEARRRIEQVLEATDPDKRPAAQRKDVRAVEVLAQIGTPEALRFLDELAAGAAESPLTRAAKAALERLDKRPAP